MPAAIGRPFHRAAPAAAVPAAPAARRAVGKASGPEAGSGINQLKTNLSYVKYKRKDRTSTSYPAPHPSASSSPSITTGSSFSFKVLMVPSSTVKSCSVRGW